MNVREAKKVLRSRMKRQRGALDMGSYRSWSSAIMEKCFSLPEWREAGTVHCYVSVVNNEVDTLGLLFSMFDGGKRVIVPKCLPGSNELRGVMISSLDELSLSRFGLMEPEYSREKAVDGESLELVIAPVVAFDRKGNRLGMGGGYYDSYLSGCSCPKVGLAYSFQEVDSVPVEPHDERVDIIITEKEIIRVGHE